MSLKEGKAEIILGAFFTVLGILFLAVIIPPARKSRVIAGVVLLAMAASCAFAYLPLFAGISAGMRVIILTVALSAGAAILFPVKEEEHGA